METAQSHPDGRSFRAHNFHLVGSVSPLSALARADEFRTLVESSHDIITVLSAEGRIHYDNPAVERVLGYPQGELVGRNAFEMIHPADYSVALALLVDLAAHPGAAATLAFRFRHRSDGWRVLESTGRHLPPEGNGEPRLVVTSRDVSDRVRTVAEIQAEREELESRLRARTRALEEARSEVLTRLARAAECRDDDTGRHTQRVGDLASALATVAGSGEGQAEALRRAAPLHDIGKIGIRDSILLKPGPLAPEELEVMRTHTVLGAGILSRGGSPLIRSAEEVALSHHERWDGMGYPQGLRGEEIPLLARIVSVADFYDAVTHARPYRPAWTRARALKALLDEAGFQFDPRLVEAFMEIPVEE